MEEIIEVKQADMLQALNRADIDAQVVTAHAYPRDINRVLNTIETLATMDQETAEDCFYVLRRKDKDGNDSVIEGLSVRMAEIIANAWTNLRVATRIIGNDGSHKDCRPSVEEERQEVREKFRRGKGGRP